MKEIFNEGSVNVTTAIKVGEAYVTHISARPATLKVVHLTLQKDYKKAKDFTECEFVTKEFVQKTLKEVSEFTGTLANLVEIREEQSINVTERAVFDLGSLATIKVGEKIIPRSLASEFLELEKNK